MNILKILKFSAISIAALVWLLPASAHHSHGNYNMTEYTPLTGEVVEMQWMNPHIWIYLEVVNADGEPEVWSLEGASPSQVIKSGWTRESVQVGDMISVRCHQLHDKDTGCLLGLLTPEGGEEKEFD